MSVYQALDEIAGQLPRWSSSSLNEAQTSQVIVLRLLQALGYDIWNPEEVFAQELGNAGIPDFIVSWQGRRRFVVEVKKLAATLDGKMKTQAVSYANNHAIRWAVLTNGVDWLLFDSFMQSKQAHNRLILSLSLNNLDTALLEQYFERLFDVSVWARPEDAVETTARDIRSHIELNSRLQPLVRSLEQLMDEYTVQDFEAGLKLAERLEIWDAETHKLVLNNLETFRQLIDNFGPREEDNSDDLISERDLSPSKLTNALVSGFGRTSPRKGEGKSSGLEAHLNGQRLEATSWRDVHAGIAEAFLILNQLDLLEEHAFVYLDIGERRMSNGKPYAPSSYRKLNNGKVLYLHYGAKDHYTRSKKLLKALDAPAGLITIKYKDKGFTLP